MTGKTGVTNSRIGTTRSWKTQVKLTYIINAQRDQWLTHLGSGLADVHGDTFAHFEWFSRISKKVRSRICKSKYFSTANTSVKEARLQSNERYRLLYRAFVYIGKRKITFSSFPLWVPTLQSLTHFRITTKILLALKRGSLVK